MIEITEGRKREEREQEFSSHWNDYIKLCEREREKRFAEEEEFRSLKLMFLLFQFLLLFHSSLKSIFSPS